MVFQLDLIRTNFRFLGVKTNWFKDRVTFDIIKIIGIFEEGNTNSRNTFSVTDVTFDIIKTIGISEEGNTNARKNFGVTDVIF